MSGAGGLRLDLSLPASSPCQDCSQDGELGFVCLAHVLFLLVNLLLALAAYMLCQAVFSFRWTWAVSWGNSLFCELCGLYFCSCINSALDTLQGLINIVWVNE